MSERVFRIILGVLLLAILYFEIPGVIYLYLAVLTFEGITNWRVPALVSRLRYGDKIQLVPCCRNYPGESSKMNFEAERALRLVVVALLIPSYFMFNELLFILPWFIGFALFGAGLSGICPMVMVLKWLGLR